MNEKNNKSLKNGSYSILITLVVVVIAVIVNLIARGLPSQFSQFDFSTSRLYTLTGTTADFLSGLDEDVTLYYICEGGKEDDTIQKLMDRYEDASPRITVEQIDPALYPAFTSRYSDEAVGNNSVIAVCGEKYKVVNADAMYISDFNYNTYSYVQTGFDGEGMVTSAIDYVTSEDIPVLYVLNGNGETALGASFRDAVEKNNIDIQNLNLLAEAGVPEDAAGIVIGAPQKDYSAETTQKILDYLEKGGKAMIFSNYTADAMPNFDSVLSNYGVAREEGIILEGDSGRYMTYQYCVIPTVNYSDITARVYGDSYLLAPMSQGIRTLDTYRDSITMQPLLATADSSYAKVDVQNMTTSEKESGDIDGPFTVGMLIQEDINNDHEAETEIVYYSTGYLLDEDYNQSVSGDNAELFGGTANYLCNGEDTSSSVAVKSLQVQYLTLTDFSANFWTVICVFVLPVLCILAGTLVWLSRRKR